MKIIALDHVQLAMPPGEEARARHFYGELLGLAEVAKPEPLAARGGCWFEGEGLAVHLGVQRDFAPSRKAHLCFQVDDLEAARQTLLRGGVPITPDESVTGVRRFYAADPFGNRLEFLQAGDHFL